MMEGKGVKRDGLTADYLHSLYDAMPCLMQTNIETQGKALISALIRVTKTKDSYRPLNTAMKDNHFPLFTTMKDNQMVQCLPISKQKCCKLIKHMLSMIQAQNGFAQARSA